jgi:ribosomal protein S18 acetylase RimI-like enzyme
MLEIRTETQLRPEEKDGIVQFLNDHNEALGLIYQPHAINLLLIDEAENIRGGLLGSTNWGWLRIDILAVDPLLRGQNWGTKLMHRAEREAVERACTMAYVDTFSFQAPAFYERLGYEVFGKLDNFPTGHSRLFLKKALQA